MAFLMLCQFAVGLFYHDVTHLSLETSHVSIQYSATKLSKEPTAQWTWVKADQLSGHHYSDVNKARPLKAKAICPRPRPSTVKAKATVPRPRPHSQGHPIMHRLAIKDEVVKFCFFLVFLSLLYKRLNLKLVPYHQELPHVSIVRM